jgi:6-phosphogluconolactonase
LRTDNGKGALLAVAFYDNGIVRLVNDENDELLPQEPIIFKESSGVIKDRQEGPHAHAAYPLESGNEFLVPDLGNDCLYKLRVSSHKARIVHEIKLAPGSGPRHVLKHPKFNLLFVVSELTNKLTVYEVDGMFVVRDDYIHLTL